MLLGSKQASVGNFDASTLSTYGLLKPQGKAYLDALFNALEDGGLIETENTRDFPLLTLTSNGVEVMHDRAEFRLVWPEQKATKKQEVQKTDLSNRIIDFDPKLYEKLKNKRAQLAAIQGNIPPYRIFSNSVLKELVIHRPQTTEEALSINGIRRSESPQTIPSLPKDSSKNPVETDMFE